MLSNAILVKRAVAVILFGNSFRSQQSNNGSGDRNLSLSLKRDCVIHRPSVQKHAQCQ